MNENAMKMTTRSIYDDSVLYSHDSAHDNNSSVTTMFVFVYFLSPASDFIAVSLTLWGLAFRPLLFSFSPSHHVALLTSIFQATNISSTPLLIATSILSHATSSLYKFKYIKIR